MATVAPQCTYTNATTLSITAGGTAQSVFAANALRRGLQIQNTSDTGMYIRYDGTSATTITSMYLAPGVGIDFAACPVGAVSIICATTGKTFFASEGV